MRALALLFLLPSLCFSMPYCNPNGDCAESVYDTNGLYSAVLYTGGTTRILAASSGDSLFGDSYDVAGITDGGAVIGTHIGYFGAGVGTEAVYWEPPTYRIGSFLGGGDSAAMFAVGDWGCAANSHEQLAINFRTGETLGSCRDLPPVGVVAEPSILALMAVAILLRGLPLRRRIFAVGKV